MSKTGAQPGSDRVPVPGGVHGEVMVFQPMTIIDISHGGVQIETEFPLQLDSLHDFRLSLGDLSLVLKGRIARCQIADLQTGGLRYRSGVEFVEPSPHVQQAIDAFVNGHRHNRESRPAIVDGELAE